MFEISVEDSFDAAHCVKDYEGACRRLHGHTYRVRVIFRFAEVAESGMALDFKEAKRALREVVEYMDHNYINDLPEFEVMNATAENVARFIHTRLRPEFESIHCVSVWETATSCATYFADE